MDFNICAEKICGYLEGKYTGRFKSREDIICDSRRILAKLKKKWRKGDNGSEKVVELKRVEDGSRTMEKFVQEFRRASRGSRYEKRALVEEFKQGMNRVIRRKLIEAERPF